MMVGVPVAIKPDHERGQVRYGLFVGLVDGRDLEPTRDGDLLVAVQLDGCGMMLTLFHPSKVVLMPQQEVRR